ncbi:zinc finger protein DHHC domain containing protein, putative [Pediculus humanus corporis]|uniref:Palmitoyltransferase n=1 Tax=Pediculus humanus subsp. corporis TaxID=121224 RepID=E0VI53_PEDHC|nr:zinc finger protein DHHC domain containing protein, putative [Pediculus humanus corporis]EEB13059.1 zinc finger protein DHHC domain containing protein, putative [Pediculus humanus corporis]
MCVTPFDRLYGWGPIITLLIIKIVSLTTVYCNAQWWPPQHSIGGLLNATTFLFLCVLVISNFLSTVFNGPGFLPKEWKPGNSDTKYLQFCNVCLGYKAPRSHHCKKCQRCVLKMDHHCPWINTCVGFKNQAQFILFLLFAFCACIQSTVILSCSLYRALNRTWKFKGWYLHFGRGTDPLVTLSGIGTVSCVFSLGLSIGVVLGVGILLFFQVRSVMRNQTGIEDWIVDKAVHRRLVAHAKGEPIEPFVFPYNLGLVQNVLQVFNRDLTPIGDGIYWSIASNLNCDQYTLTREQIEQKSEKKSRAKPYAVVKKYSGRWFPVVFGFKVLFSIPCTDENRLRLNVGDNVLVTRWRKNWLFGEMINKEGGDQIEQKGWFPRCCVIEINGNKLSKSVTDDDKKTR